MVSGWWWLSQVTDSLLLTVSLNGRERDCSSSLSKATNSIRLGPTLMTSCNLNYYLKALSSTIVTLRVSASTHKFGDTVQYTAMGVHCEIQHFHKSMLRKKEGKFLKDRIGLPVIFRYITFLILFCRTALWEDFDN